jgi:hypothetical protein
LSEFTRIISNWLWRFFPVIWLDWIAVRTLDWIAAHLGDEDQRLWLEDDPANCAWLATAIMQALSDIAPALPTTTILSVRQATTIFGVCLLSATTTIFRFDLATTILESARRRIFTFGPPTTIFASGGTSPARAQPRTALARLPTA